MTAAQLPKDLTIHAGWPDRPSLESLYTAAFPDEDLLPLLPKLQAAGDEVLSLYGMTGDGLVAHIAFTISHVDHAPAKLALLGPLAVTPTRQRQGLGKAMIAEGHARLADQGVAQTFLLGDPNYYGRSGYTVESDVMPPHPIPEDWKTAWQSQTLDGAAPCSAGTLITHAAWDDPTLWSD